MVGGNLRDLTMCEQQRWQASIFSKRLGKQRPKA
jgi:hypothetical protein